MTDIIIALDAMGGDFGPPVVVPAAIEALKEMPALHLRLVGDERALTSLLQQHKAASHPRLQIVHASEKVEMDELPSQALRTKKDSSMRVALNLVKEEAVQACVSAGNTGALMATARFVLKMLPGIDRPAIICGLPTPNEKLVRVLDLGANVDVSAEQLYQFGVMGSVLAQAVSGIPSPKVALLNIGEEEIKGNEQVKAAAQLLADEEHVNYVGYIEGDDIYKGNVDVVVCDGFVGNVMLKASEGMIKLMVSVMKAEYKKNLLSKLAAIASWGVMRGVKRKMDPANYNGASFLGLQGIVVKSHGSASVRSYVNAIRAAVREVEHNVPQLIHDELAEKLEDSNE